MNVSPRVVILTGAGISAESGLKTFRDNNGLWENHKVEEVATPQAFASNPDLVYRFYNLRRAQLQDEHVQPNAAHIALAKLERALGDDVLIVTQNVDNLHERAGTQRILHMHGELLAARCCQSQQVIAWSSSFDASTPCTCCEPSAQLRPDIVWFGEMPMHMNQIILALSKAKLFIAIGTSGQVYPAAGFVQVANDSGADTIEINLEPSAKNSNFNRSIIGLASETVPQYVDELITTLNP